MSKQDKILLEDIEDEYNKLLAEEESKSLWAVTKLHSGVIKAFVEVRFDEKICYQGSNLKLALNEYNSL